MNLRLPELQNNNKKTKVLRAGGLPEDWKDVEGVLQYQRLPYVPEIIRSEVISRHHDDSLAKAFWYWQNKRVGWLEIVLA